MVSRSRMPPPSWIGILSLTAAAIALIACSFLGRPAAAPLRSMTCSRRAPSLSQRSAVAPGSSENTVALSITPCLRRTHLPSLRSMAGMISMSAALCGGESGSRPRRAAPDGLPCDEVGE